MDAMDATTSAPPTQEVYCAQGSYSVRVAIWAPEISDLVQVPTIADMVPACRIMSRDVVCAQEDLEVDALMDLIIRRHIGCVPVVDDRGHPVGMVTKFDLVEQLLAMRDAGGARPALTAADVMMPLAITLDEHATVAHAAAMMSVEDVHHVPIVAEGGTLIGVVSTMDIVRWLAANDGVLTASLDGASLDGSLAP